MPSGIVEARSPRATRRESSQCANVYVKYQRAKRRCARRGRGGRLAGDRLHGAARPLRRPARSPQRATLRRGQRQRLPLLRHRRLRRPRHLQQPLAALPGARDPGTGRLRRRVPSAGEARRRAPPLRHANRHAGGGLGAAATRLGQHPPRRDRSRRAARRRGAEPDHRRRHRPARSRLAATPAERRQHPRRTRALAQLDPLARRARPDPPATGRRARPRAAPRRPRRALDLRTPLRHDALRVWPLPRLVRERALAGRAPRADLGQPHPARADYSRADRAARPPHAESLTG